MKRNQPTRREVVENCIVRGALVAGVPMSTSNLFALWQKGESQAQKPTLRPGQRMVRNVSRVGEWPVARKTA